MRLHRLLLPPFLTIAVVTSYLTLVIVDRHAANAVLLPYVIATLVLAHWNLLVWCRMHKERKAHRRRHGLPA